MKSPIAAILLSMALAPAMKPAGAEIDRGVVHCGPKVVQVGNLFRPAMNQPNRSPKVVQAKGGSVLLIASKAVESTTAAAAMLDPTHAIWNDAPSRRLHLNRTPPLYAADALDTGERPIATVSVLRLAGDRIVIRVQWTDATENVGPVAKTYRNGGADHVYGRHSEEVASFGDAVCVAVPKQRGPQKTYPSMIMGDAAHPVDLCYWRAGIGFELLSAHGRATTAGAPAKLQGMARRLNDAWCVIFVLPNVPSRTPICFAFWNGDRQDRAGLKCYSLWYEVE